MITLCVCFLNSLSGKIVEDGVTSTANKGAVFCDYRIAYSTTICASYHVPLRVLYTLYWLAINYNLNVLSFGP